MKKRAIAVGCLELFLVTGVNAGHNRRALQAPVCRFIDFYIAAGQSEMNAFERIAYSLAAAAKKVEYRCASSPAGELISDR